MTLISKKTLLGRLKTLDFLGEVDAKNGEAARSFYFCRGMSMSEIERQLEKVVSPDALPEVAELVLNSKTGAIIFWGSELKCLVIPPFPITDQRDFTGYEVKPLLGILQSDFTIALVLVRLGAYAIGICRGDSLLDSKAGTGLIHARHKKGGSSQKRFQRHREKQIESFLIRVCGHIREHLEPRLRSIDYLVYGGARTTILSLQKRCDFLHQLDNRVFTHLLDVPEPRRVTLEAAIGRVWSSNVFYWEEG